jgi:uncharacterized protein YggE
MNLMNNLLPIVVTLVALTAAGVAQQPEPRESKPRTVSVRGMGVVTTAPDQVRLTISVNTRGESAATAMSSASARTREILGILKAFGVEEKEIQTSRVTVTPVYDYEKRIQPPPIVGYTGTNEFTVLFKGKLMDRAGEFIDRAVTAGAAGFSGLMYEASKQRELEREALKRAAIDAQARADVLAKELGATLGRVMSISESVGTAPQPYDRGMMATEAAGSAAPVMTGELSIRANVDVVFELK